ncbi:MAG: hypothetical protein RLY14_368 [Planctomycetota bacterium]|jgi:hypothetical protein
MVSEFIREVTERLSLPQGRRVGQPGHEVARRYLLELMTDMQLRPFRDHSSLELKFQKDGVDFCNLVGVVPGRDSKLPPLLIGAHYDSFINGPSSDDNATAVAVTLAVAKKVLPEQLERDLVIAVFDSEEPPHFLTETMGSKRFVEDHCQGFTFAAAIIMDLIGHDVELALPNAERFTNLLAVMGCESQPILPGIVEAAAATTSDLSVIATLNETIGDMSDHHAFRLRDVPYLFLSCGQGKYYHTRQDDLRWINFDKVTATARFVEKLIHGIDAQSSAETCRAKEHDPYRFEITRLEKVFGPMLQAISKQLSLSWPLQSRQDIDAIIGFLRGTVFEL